jgi:dihydroneopterin aldolase
MPDWIRLNRMRFQACHGALAHEATTPQAFEVDVAMAADLVAAGESDSLDDTVNYAEVAQVVAAIFEGPPVSLLERLAARIADQVLAMPRVKTVCVRVRKMAPPLGVFGAYAEVEVERGG